MSAALLTVAALCVHAYDFEMDGIYYNILSSTDRTVEVTYKDTDYNSYSGEVSIPDKLTYSGIEFTVTEIGKYAFYESTGLSSVKIPDSVVSINDKSFMFCTGMTEIKIPDSVVSIGEDVFWDCGYLKKVDLGNSVVTIGEYAFHGCSNLAGVIIPNSVTTIGPSAFSMCSSLQSIALPSSVTSIGDNMFEECTSLTSVILSESLTEITEYMFASCTSLKTIDIPKSVTHISLNAFSDSGLESIVIPDEVIRIEPSAFYGCLNMKEVMIGKSVMNIRSGVFRNCTTLTSITSLNPDAPECYSDTFTDVNKVKCKVYVPEGSVDAYKAAEGWKEFLFIEPISDSGVDETGVDAEDVTAVGYYDLQGVRLDAPAKGVNIVVYSDGTRRKVVL